MQKLVEKQTNKIYFHLKTQKEMIQYEFILQFCNIVFFKKYHFKIQDKELFHWIIHNFDLIKYISLPGSC